MGEITKRELSQELVNELDEVTQHLAQNAALKHTANEISIVNPETEYEQDLQTFANELFQLGNNVKVSVVDALLLLEQSLLINHDSSWEDICLAIESVSVGKKWALGEYQGQSLVLTVSGLEFKPSIILVICDTKALNNYDYNTSAGYGNVTLYSSVVPNKVFHPYSSTLTTNLDGSTYFVNEGAFSIRSGDRGDTSGRLFIKKWFAFE